MGSEWVHLRLCLSCGHVGCCDDSPNRHATKHFRKIHHPIIRSLEPGEDWGWCFIDELVMEPAPGAPQGGPGAAPGRSGSLRTESID